MSKLVITDFEYRGKKIRAAALSGDRKIIEIRLSSPEAASILHNIYVGKVDTVSENIGAAFVDFAPGLKGYLNLSEADQAIYISGSLKNNKIRPGDELLVQVSREAMKGKLPALTTNLTLSGRYIILTTGNKSHGYSSKLEPEKKGILSQWMQEIGPDMGFIVRTNAADAEKSQLISEYHTLSDKLEAITSYGIHRTPGSLIYTPIPDYLSMVRDLPQGEVEEIVTDISVIMETCNNSGLAPVRLYSDRLLPLHKLYSLEKVLDQIFSKKVWLKSGGFLMIEQTEAFVCVDVNSGKYTSDKKAEEARRKINLEAAKEIARQIRLRNLSGIILIDFINMKNPDHIQELMGVFGKYLRNDPVKCILVDMTKLQIAEMTRKKMHPPVTEEFENL